MRYKDETRHYRKSGFFNFTVREWLFREDNPPKENIRWRNGSRAFYLEVTMKKKLSNQQKIADFSKALEKIFDRMSCEDVKIVALEIIKALAKEAK